MSNHDHGTIERCPHDAQNPYAQISRDLIRDASISPQCRWLIIYLLSNADGWVIKPKQIYTHTKGFIGKGAIYELLNEAIDAGYIKRETYQENNLTRYRYYLSETPKFKKSFRCPGFRDTGRRDTENHDTLKKDQSSPNGEDKKKHLKEREEASPPPASSFFVYESVKMKNKEYDELIEAHGKEVVDDYIKNLANYSNTHPKKFKEYGSHAAVVRTWIKRDNDKKPIDSNAASEEENKKIAAKVINSFPKEYALGHIQAKANGILFEYGRVYELIEFKDIEFRDKLAVRLAFMNKTMDHL